MGTTIRRQPVSFDIPKSPDYKFLNITNFRGLDVSSNPFELSSNTASDCLNVYVDETNTLTTRPRLERKHFINHNGDEVVPLAGEHIGTYNLHNGYLLHYLKDAVGVMATLIDNRLTLISGKDLTPDEEELSKKEYVEIPITKCECFEQGDDIFLLNGERYMIVRDGILNDVDGYIPTTSVVDTSGIRHSVESLNLLSSNYDEKYMWNGLTSLPILENDVVIDNSYIKVDVLDSNGENFIDQYTHVYTIYPDNSMLVSKNNKIYYIHVEKNVAKIIDTSITTTDIVVRCATEKKAFWVSYLTNGVRYYKYNYYDERQQQWLSDAVKTYSTEIDSPKDIATDNSGNYLLLLGDGNNYNTWLIERVDSQTYNKKDIGSVYIDGRVKIIMRSTNAFVNFAIISGGTNDIYSALSGVYRGDTQEFLGSKSTGLSTITSLNIDDNNEYIYLTGQRESDSKWSLSIVPFGTGSPEVTPFVRVNDSFRMSQDKSYAWFTPDFEGSDTPMSIGLYINPQTTQERINLIQQTFLAKRLFYKPQSYLLVITEGGGSFTVWNDTIEENITIRKTIESHQDWSDKRRGLLKGKLFTRFDNNYWIASGNRYYRSQNNNPTYFPITEYNDLGDANSDITGFNLANDTTLIAYKNDKVFLIQQFTTSDNDTKYAITESKNTVGNTAVGAPIVTTLTEIPLQINYDGVYGLSQLSNVSSTERIADLMSEPINERWLKIDDDILQNAKTLNRLYWTYIILPDVSSEKTMIYLLDNRTTTWYYWELPIVVAHAFVKNNITELVDNKGLIYKLTTSDILDINYSDEQVTKYYDEGMLLIPWFWQSQILPMGTMNYSKRLVNTTFILTDTDDNDGYGLQYQFKVFRKLASSTPEKELSDKLTLVRSTTKKTNISKFGFLQLRISNLTEQSRDFEAFENNKLRLVGLGLKYVLLEGFMR